MICLHGITTLYDEVFLQFIAVHLDNVSNSGRIRVTERVSQEHERHENEFCQTFTELPSETVSRLEGDDLFRKSGLVPASGDRRQRPRAMVISCCDSRVHVTSIFGAEQGEFFIHRNIANLVPPYAPDGDHHGTSAAIEYAVIALGCDPPLAKIFF